MIIFHHQADIFCHQNMGMILRLMHVIPTDDAGILLAVCTVAVVSVSTFVSVEVTLFK